MNRRILGLLAAVCLASACKEEPVGKLEPIPRPANQPAPPAQAEAPKPAPAPEPPADPSKVTLRWRLAMDAPSAFRLTSSTSTTEAAPPAPKGRKGRKPPPPPPTTRTSETASTYVLQKTEAGDYTFLISPPKAGGEPAQGSMSERGFVLDGLSGPLRNVSVLVLELPRDAVGVGDSWSLSTDLVDLSTLPGFVEQKAERRNQVKLASLTPEGNGEQVATLEYDLSEHVSGQLRGRAGAAKTQGTPADDSDDKPSGPQAVSSELRVKGRGEFLVKAGRWRSWEGTLTTRTQGVPGASGEHQLRLTPLETVPPELLPKQAKQ